MSKTSERNDGDGGPVSEAGANGRGRQRQCEELDLCLVPIKFALISRHAQMDGRTCRSSRRRGARARLLLRSSSLNDKKMLFGELMVTDMAP